MQRIRNKWLQKSYISNSIHIFNLDTKNSNIIKIFNYTSLVRYKYYLSRRANNVL